MQKPTRREWLGILLAPLSTAAFAATALHLLSQPYSFTSGGTTRSSSGADGWSFRETFPELLLTFLAVSFVYHLTILPYIRSHNRRSSLVLTTLSGPVLGIWIFTVGLILSAILYPKVIAHTWESLVTLVTYPRHAVHSLGWIFLLAGITAIFTVFTVNAALLALGRRAPARSPHIRPDGVAALRGSALIGGIMLPLLFLWITEWKRGSDRAQCIMNIRNVQQAVRSHNGMNGISTGPAPGFSKHSIIGPGKFIDKMPVCPAGGAYTWIEEGRTPEIGELMMRCSVPGHNPPDHHEW